MNKDKKELWLSASRIKTYLSCSLKYWGTYHCNLPREGNSGSMRGSIVHLLSECILKKGKRSYVDQVLADKTITTNPVLVRFIKWQMIREGLTEIDHKGVDNFKLMDEMIYVAFNYDFFCDKEELDSDFAETLFKLESESPRYKILGYIDKFSRTKCDQPVGAVRDYKTSASHFTDKELSFEVQAFSYSLYVKRAMEMSSFVEFIFLRFPDDPVRRIEVDDETLNGFEEWLADVYAYLENFDESDSLKTLAVDMGWLPKEDGFKGAVSCGYAKFPNHSYSETHKDKAKQGKPYFACSEKWPYEYYVVKNEDGKVIKSTKNIEELAGEENIEVRQWKGCPKWTSKIEYKEWLEEYSI